MRLLCVLFGISLLGLGGCADAIPEARNADSESEVLVEIVGEGAPLSGTLYWPYFANGRPSLSSDHGILAAGTRHAVIARHPSGAWLRVGTGWIRTDDARLVFGVLELAPIVLFRGLWLLSPDSGHDPFLVTEYADWNSWQ